MPYLYLVRHGQPDFAGNYDSITALGARQSTWLGEHFAGRGLRFARVLAGTLQRQVSTCERVLSALDGSSDFTQDARFNEYDHLALLQFFEGRRAIRRSFLGQNHVAHLRGPCKVDHDPAISNEFIEDLGHTPTLCSRVALDVGPRQWNFRTLPKRDNLALNGVHDQKTGWN